jgi:hypothetical protein
MTLEELAARLEELEHSRKVLEAELAALERTQQKAEELKADRDTALASLAAAIPEALDGLTGEEINAVYRKLRLRVVPSEEGYDATGVLCTLRPTPVDRRGPRGLRSKAARLQTSGFRKGPGRRFMWSGLYTRWWRGVCICARSANREESRRRQGPET